MQKRKLGNSNLEVSALGLGCTTAAKFTVQGARYPENLERRTGR
jgi:aryl-alcohol dehydrogenase-like predicted oxidoreductase